MRTVAAEWWLVGCDAATWPYAAIPTIAITMPAGAGKRVRHVVFCVNVCTHHLGIYVEAGKQRQQITMHTLLHSKIGQQKGGQAKGASMQTGRT